MTNFTPIACRAELTPGQGRRIKSYLSLCPVIQSVVNNDGGIRIASNLDIVYDTPFLDCYPDIIVESGAKLTIQIPMEFDQGKGIYIEEGGRVEVHGVTLSGCNGGNWHGIEVKGTSNFQFPYVANGQGQLKLNTGSELINAEFPIKATGGAYIKATSANFANCGTVGFSNYTSFFNLSEFYDCRFTRDAGYGFSHIKQFQLENMGQMSIRGCTFKSTVADNNNRGFSAMDSRFYIGESSAFEGYLIGVEAYSWVSNPNNFYISSSTFKNNSTGISTWNTNNFTVKDNTFEGIGNFSNRVRQVGLAFRDCSGFTISGNSFEGILGVPENAGVFALNSGSESNAIVSNTFEGFFAANWALGDNKGAFPTDGLQYLCNTNNSPIGNTYDFLVAGEGIAGIQGGDLATKNIFSHFNPDKGDFNNQGDGLIYRHASPQEETPNPGGYYFNIEPVLTIDETNCTDGGGGGGQVPYDDGNQNLTQGEVQQLIQDFNTVETNYNTELSAYQSLLNGGQTEAGLSGQVMAATSQNVAQLEQSLLSYSPYLTTRVLESVVVRSDIFSDNSIKSILIANPDELRSLDFHSFLYGELDGALVDTILAIQFQTTVRTSSEATLTRHKIDMHRFANRMVKDILLDTTGVDFTKYRLWLDNKGSVEAEYEKVLSYTREGDYTSARSVRDNLPTAFNLQGDDLTEHTYFTTLSEIGITALEDTIPAWGYDSLAIVQIQTIADNSQGLSASMARGLLNFYYRYDYQMLPYQSGGQQLVSHPPVLSGAASAAHQPLTALPNPARGQVTFRYDLEKEGNGPASLLVFDLNGKLIKSFVLEGLKGAVDWNTGDLPIGVYYCRVRQSGTAYPSLRLAIIK